MTIYISLDCETWGKRPGCDIRSIGAVVFDPTTGYVANPYDGGEQFGQSFYRATDNPSAFPYDWGDRGGEPPRKYSLTRDPETVSWWSEQNAEAQNAFAHPIDLRDALIQFTEWLENVTQTQRGTAEARMPLNKWNGLRIYTHGPAFDPNIIEAAYHACNLPVPWFYRAHRDTRTTFDDACIDDHSAWLNQHPGPLGVLHHALDDAICQARAVCSAWKRMEIPQDVRTHREAWRKALENCRDEADAFYNDPDVSYWEHELEAFDRTFDRLLDGAHRLSKD